MCANEAAGLREEAMRLRRRLVASQRGEPGEWLADAEEAHAMAVEIVSEAQVAADRYVADAQAYAGRIGGTPGSGGRKCWPRPGRRDAKAQARDAALAALGEAVPAETTGALRAARAGAAYQGKFDGVYLTHVPAVQLAARLEYQGLGGAGGWWTGPPDPEAETARRESS